MDEGHSEIYTSIQELRAEAAKRLVGNEYDMVVQQLDMLANSPELAGSLAQSILDSIKSRLGTAPHTEETSESAVGDANAPEASPEEPAASLDTTLQPGETDTPSTEQAGTPESPAESDTLDSSAEAEPASESDVSSQAEPSASAEVPGDDTEEAGVISSCPVRALSEQRRRPLRSASQPWRRKRPPRLKRPRKRLRNLV